MADTPNLALPLMDAAQAQKHVTHNEALAALDACVQLSVLARDVATPPPAPAPGGRWLVGAGAQGAFAGRAGQVASWDEAGWRFLVPRAGWLAWSVADDAAFVFDGAAWTRFDGKIAALQNLQRLGLGATADAANPLLVKANATLFAARPPAEGGDGDLRFKLNKSAPGGVLSQLYQTNWSGRAETGLMGDDRFRIKVSDDGAQWRVALEIAPATGAALVPPGALAAPGLAFIGEEGAGLMRPAAGALALVTDGAERLRVSADGAAADVLTARRLRRPPAAVRAVAGAAYALVPADDGCILLFTSDAPVALAVPAGLGAGFACRLIQGGAGAVQLAAAAGVALGNPRNAFRTAGRHAVADLLGVAADAHVLSGDVVA